MVSKGDNLNAFGETRSESLDFRACALRSRLHSVTMLCQLAESEMRYSSPHLGIATLQRARRALDGLRQQFSDARFLVMRDAPEIERKMIELESKLVRVGQRVRVAMEALKVSRSS